MFRIDADGHDGNRFTEGNPSLGERATKVSDEWLNTVQEEIAGVVLGSGTALNKADEGQLLAALQVLFSTGGVQPGGRLCLSRGNPTANNINDSVFYTPYLHDKVPLWDGTRWKWHTFSELSQTTDNDITSPAAGEADSNYDVFVWLDGATLRATRGPKWTSDSARGTGAGTTELEVLSGRRVNKVAIANGPAAQRGLYVGTIRTIDTVEVQDNNAKRYVWNAYNRIERLMERTESTDSWTYTTQTFREVRGDALNRLAFVIGLEGDTVWAEARGLASNTQVGAELVTGIGLNRTNGNDATVTIPGIEYVAGYNAPMFARYQGSLAIGAHYLSWLEWSAAVNTTTWVGDGGIADNRRQTGILGSVRG